MFAFKDWKNPDVLRQTPNGAGIWDGIRFTLDDVTHFDYAIVLNRVSEGTSVQCPRNHLWAIMQEPPLHRLRYYVRRARAKAQPWMATLPQSARG